MCSVRSHKTIHNVISVFYQKHCGTLIPLGSEDRKGVVFKGIDFWGVSGGRLDRTGSRREMRRRIDWIWSAPFFSSFFSLFFLLLFRTHARFFFSSRKPGEFGQYIKHTHARTVAVDRSCNQLSGKLMVCSIECSKRVFFFYPLGEKL